MSQVAHSSLNVVNNQQDTVDTSQNLIDIDADSQNDNTDSVLASLSVKTPRIIKTRTLSLNSLPDLSSNDDTAAVDELSLQVTDDMFHSAPHICLDDTSYAAKEERNGLGSNTHHSTAPDLQALAGALPPASMLPPANHSSNDQIKMSFSDDGFKQFSVIAPNSHGLGRSPLSKLKSGLSQVSQLIVNPNSSPQTRRRQQVLEAQVLDNTVKSNLRFKNCKTKILLL